MALCVFFLSVFTFSHVHNVVIANIVSAVLDRQTGILSLLPGFKNDFVAWADFTDDITNTGWAYLEVSTSSQYNDSLQAYAAGVVEAAVTSPLIGKHWMNTMKGYCDGKYDDGYCERLRDYILANLQWMEEQMDKGEDLEFWHQIRLALLQLKGLEDHYNGKVDFPVDHFSINPFGLLLFQMSGDLEDLEAALNQTAQSKPLGSGSCSALIKLLPGNKELLVAHDTWSNYQSMLRIMKKYSFAYKRSPKDGTPIPGGIQAFSSYPGTIFSGDDFYILSSGMVVLETTIGNSNPALWKFVNPRLGVMEWLRNIVANRLAESGDQWAALFSKYNSGTYNNQWMIVDYNHFTPGKTDMEDELLTVLEQIPGLIVSRDKTKELLQNGYWASYNIPYYENIFNISGCPELVEKYGDWFSFDMNPRAQIFRRNQSLVTDMDSMVRLMRYNNFKEDPLSKCRDCDPPNNGENAISARSDLNPANGTYPFGALKQRPHGGTDMKIDSKKFVLGVYVNFDLLQWQSTEGINVKFGGEVTSYAMYKEYQLLAASGPTHDQVPVFQWSTSPYSGLLHVGHPDRWDFPTIFIKWS